MGAGAAAVKVLVSGGGGFIGLALVRRLLERGDTPRSFSRSRSPALEALGVEQRCGDLADAQAVQAAADGCELVFHVAAKAGVWGRSEDFYRTNVLGTRNVVQACLALGIQRLVYTSSPSVVFSGGDIKGGDESLPYSRYFIADYPRTKAQAERELRAASSAQLMTISLRPHLVFGPGDPHFLPRLAARARKGQLRRIGQAGQVGNDDKRVDCTYIDNVVDAHLLAADKLCPALSGRVYFITNDEPRPTWQLVGSFLEAASAPAVTRSISPRLAYALASVMEGTWRLLRLRSEPRLTRFVVQELSSAHYFDISAARRDLGYEPKVNLNEGFKRLKASLSAPVD